MGLLFEKAIDAFLADPELKIVSRRLLLADFNFLDRVDLTFRQLKKVANPNIPIYTILAL